MITQCEIYTSNLHHATAYFDLIVLLYKMKITCDSPDSYFEEPPVELVPLGAKGFCVLFHVSNSQHA